VRAPERTGFGTTVIRDLPRRGLDAEVELDYAAEGLRWSLKCDGSEVLVGGGPPGP
jgi:hypothetical protein